MASGGAHWRRGYSTGHVAAATRGKGWKKQIRMYFAITM